MPVFSGQQTATSRCNGLGGLAEAAVNLKAQTEAHNVSTISPCHLLHPAARTSFANERHCAPFVFLGKAVILENIPVF